jgi:hypothetical protein
VRRLENRRRVRIELDLVVLVARPLPHSGGGRSARNWTRGGLSSTPMRSRSRSRTTRQITPPHGSRPPVAVHCLLHRLKVDRKPLLIAQVDAAGRVLFELRFELLSDVVGEVSPNSLSRSFPALGFPPPFGEELPRPRWRGGGWRRLRGAGAAPVPGRGGGLVSHRLFFFLFPVLALFVWSFCGRRTPCARTLARFQGSFQVFCAKKFFLSAHK